MNLLLLELTKILQVSTQRFLNVLWRHSKLLTLSTLVMGRSTNCTDGRFHKLIQHFDID